jgi:hypothetical protein
MDLLAVLAPLAQSPVNVTIPPLSLTVVLSRLFALIPLIGGYLLAREGKGNLLWEVLAVTLLVLATVVPVEPKLEGLPNILSDLVSRYPVALLLLGLAFVRDGGIKMILGLALMVFSGLILLPRVA